MRWKELVIGAVITLAVTIVGGLAVYVFTREPRPTERLVYEDSDPVAFDLPTTKRSFATIRAGNVGTAAARDVVIVVTPTTPILEKSATLSSGPAATFQDTSTKSEVRLQIPSMLPAETLTITLMLDGVVQSRPTVTLRSASSKGEAGSLVEPAKARSMLDKGLSSFAVSVAAQVVLFTLAMLALRYRVLRIFPSGRSQNNTAFVWLHNGLPRQAALLLRSAINQSGASPNELANYGLAIGLQPGRAEEGRKHLACARWWATTSHERAVAEFGLALLDVSTGAVQAGLDHLKEALRLSKSEIARYCAFSVHVAGARKAHPSVEEFLASRGIESRGA